MITHYLAVICADQYEAFRRVLTDNLPNAFDGWEQLRTQRCANIKGAGADFELIEIDFDEFVSFCEAIDAQKNVHSLDALAFKKAQEAQRNHGP